MNAFFYSDEERNDAFAVAGFVISAILLLALFISHYSMMTTQGMWIQLMMPGPLLVTGHTLLTTKRFFLLAKGKKRFDPGSAE